MKKENGLGMHARLPKISNMMFSGECKFIGAYMDYILEHAVITVFFLFD